jgi:hypothetical protein
VTREDEPVSTAADKIKANAERLRAKTPATSAAAPTDELPGTSASAPAAPAAVVRQKNIRRTVDLSPAAHRALDTWQSQIAERLGLARVTGQEVLAALVELLLADDDLRERVTQSVAANR